MAEQKAILVGATGDLRMRVAKALAARKADVRALVRASADAEKIKAIKQLGIDVVTVDFQNSAALIQACRGGHVVVSTLSGLRDVIVARQSAILDAAVAAGVERFIPSDYGLDFTTAPSGSEAGADCFAENQTGRLLGRCQSVHGRAVFAALSELLKSRALLIRRRRSFTLFGRACSIYRICLAGWVHCKPSTTSATLIKNGQPFATFSPGQKLKKKSEKKIERHRSPGSQGHCSS